MALSTFQILDESYCLNTNPYRTKWNPGVKKYMKNQLTRKNRRVPADQIPNFKYKGW